MKILGSLLFVFLGTIGMALAQNNADSLKNSLKVPHFYGRQFLQTPSLDTLNSGFPRSDSSFTLLPRRLYSERNLDFLSSPKFRVGMPTYKLPDPQSRMPVRGFEDSVNYTLQIKKYD
ncbi:MAG: hypothetical protein LPK25_17055 [Cyclobacteriaceae bacterium]|nr:hypothetical protein [Cyclobacteriaceae bacterium]MDX5468060.1 hypothetical protein [Cyclobacteriaceae bacterium]